MNIPEGWQLPEFDLGYLNDYGGGNIGWWQDYIRDSLRLAHEHYQEQLEDMLAAAPILPAQEPDLSQEARDWYAKRRSAREPAQEDEPVLYQYRSHYCEEWLPCRKDQVDALRSHGGKVRALYTHPDSELRKAAEELLVYIRLHASNQVPFYLQQNLRAALEKK